MWTSHTTLFEMWPPPTLKFLFVTRPKLRVVWCNFPRKRMKKVLKRKETKGDCWGVEGGPCTSSQGVEKVATSSSPALEGGGLGIMEGPLATAIALWRGWREGPSNPSQKRFGCKGHLYNLTSSTTGLWLQRLGHRLEVDISRCKVQTM